MSLDPLIYTYAAYKLNATSIYLGICSALWSVFYILASISLGVLGDRGKARFLILISLIATIFSLLFLTNFSTFTAAIAYILHAISIAAINLSINILVFETIDSSEWGKTIFLTRVLGYIARGIIMMLAITIRSITITTIQQMVIIFLLISIVLMPSPPVLSERGIYKMYSLLRDLGSYLKASSSLLYIDRPATVQTIFESIWNRYNYASIGKVVTIVMLVTAIGDYVSAFLPLTTKNIIDLSNMWLAYCITSIASPIIMMILRNIESANKGLALLLILLRSFILTAGIMVIRDIITLTVYILTTSALYFAIDSILYNLFISLSGGYRSSTYYSLRELGSIVGSILGGFILYMGMGIYTLIALVMTIICVALLMS